MVMLNISSLHSSLSDPVLDSINFLNEIIDRFPDAISFAPGAPHNSFFDSLHIPGYIDSYVNHLTGKRRLTREQALRHLYQYGPAQGQINDLVAEALRLDHGIEVSPAAIVITVGCQEGMLLVLRALFARPGDVLAVAHPCFSGIIGAARLLGVEVQPVGESDDGIDLDQLRTVFETARKLGKRIRALYLIPDFANPSGAVCSLPVRRQLLDLADREDFLVLEDNAYGFTASSEHALPTLKALDTNGRVVYLGTFSKIGFPGARVGFVVADQEVRRENGPPRSLSKELATIKSMITVNTSPICQAIIGGMMLENGGSLNRMSQEKAAFYRKNLKLLLDALESEFRSKERSIPGLSWNAPGGGFFIRVRLPVVVDNALLEVSANRYKVLWTPMSYFNLKDVANNELRLSCSYLTPAEIEEGVRRLAQFLRDHCAV